jgi:hypothetical protein
MGAIPLASALTWVLATTRTVGAYEARFESMRACVDEMRPCVAELRMNQAVTAERLKRIEESVDKIDRKLDWVRVSGMNEARPK